MNILIPYSWLKEYLETTANPAKIATCLSLRSTSVEKIEKIGNESVFHLEITTNRVDLMSVFGLARELVAVLPQFGTKAKLKKDLYKEFRIMNDKLRVKKQKNLKVIIKDKSLCPRFSAVILENVTVKPSPKIIQERLIMSGIRPINNLVDVTNYLMKELGQPAHVFDYHKIGQQTMILRLSNKGEKLTTLDGKTHLLQGNEIVIEDGCGQLIDLCGIMGGKNSQVTDKTTSVLLFVQTYNPFLIRQTMMKLGIQSEAASLFEKSPDPEMVWVAINQGITLIIKHAGSKFVNKIIDIYPKPYQSRTLKCPIQLIEQYLGINVQLNKVIQILNSLGFKTKLDAKRLALEAEAPSWRAKDIQIPQDLVEEIARIYGYHNLPSLLPPLLALPPKQPINFDLEEKVKQTLKNWGLTEVYTYSMQSALQLNNLFLETKKHLKVKNPLSKEWQYMRRNLLPSLLSVVKQNEGVAKTLKLFELSHVYLRQKNNLPLEKLKLAVVFTGNQYQAIKGLVSGLLLELNINQVEFLPRNKNLSQTWYLPKTALLANSQNQDVIGQVGEIHPQISTNFGLKQTITAAYLDWEKLISLIAPKKYHPLLKYPAILEELTITVTTGVFYTDLIKVISTQSPLINKIELVDIFKNNLTLKITYLDPQGNLTDSKVALVREKIIAKVQGLGLGTVKQKVAEPLTD